MTRADWQQIAEERLLSAKALLDSKLFASAYYLAGYALEGGLKSCILVRIAACPEVLFQDGGNKFSVDCWTHDIVKLVRLAGLDSVLAADAAANRALGVHWQIAKDWTEKSRYQMASQNKANALYNALADNSDGVMQWIRVRW